MFNKRFWQAAIIRAVRTVAQTAIATIGTAALLSQVNWLAVLSASALAGILSVLTSISTGLPEAVEADGAWLDASRTIELEEDEGWLIDDVTPEEAACHVTVRNQELHPEVKAQAETNGDPSTAAAVPLPLAGEVRTWDVETEDAEDGALACAAASEERLEDGEDG